MTYSYFAGLSFIDIGGWKVSRRKKGRVATILAITAAKAAACQGSFSLSGLIGGFAKERVLALAKVRPRTVCIAVEVAERSL